MRLAFLGERFQMGRSHLRTLEVCLFLALACSCAAALDSDRTIGQFAHTAWGPKDGAPVSFVHWHKPRMVIFG